MNTQNTKPRKAFSYPFSTLLNAAQRIEGAFSDNTVGDAVSTHFAPTFVTDYSAQIAALATAMDVRDNAKSTAGDRVKVQNAALRTYRELAASARTAAKLAFPDAPVTLHSSFGVGAKEPNSFAAIEKRAETLVAGCIQYADALSAHGWSTESQAALMAAVDALKSTHLSQHVASDDKEGLTGRQIEYGNALARMVRAIQGVARREFPASKVASDSSLITKRARFLLGEFPPRRSAQPPEDPAPTPGSGGSSSSTPNSSPATTQ